MDTATAGDRNSLAHVGRTLSTIVQQAITQADAAGIDLQVPASLRAYASATTADTPPTPAPQDLPRLISDLDAATRSLYERTSA